MQWSDRRPLIHLSDSKIKLELLVDKFSAGKQTKDNKTAEPNDNLHSKAILTTSILSKWFNKYQ